MHKPVKINSHLVLVYDQDTPKISSPLGLHPVEVISEVEMWIHDNHSHPRCADVTAWLEVYEAQHPIPANREPLTDEQYVRALERMELFKKLLRKMVKHVISLGKL